MNTYLHLHLRSPWLDIYLITRLNLLLWRSQLSFLWSYDWMISLGFIIPVSVCVLLNNLITYWSTKFIHDYGWSAVPILNSWHRMLQVLGVTEREFFDQMGVHFVGFVGQYGYDRVLSVLGRHMRDFLNGNW